MTVAVGAVLLAAGGSERFGADNKLLADVGGEPLVRRVAGQLEGLAKLVIVTGHDADGVVAALVRVPARFAHNGDWQLGMGSSIGVGIKALGGGLDGAFVVPGDLAFLRRGLIEAMVAAFEADERRPIVFPATPEGKQRNPVLWPARFFADLASLPPAEGAKALIERHAEEAKAITVEDAAAFSDIDTPAELAAARARLGRHD